MNGIAAKIAEETFVFFKDRHFYAGTRRRNPSITPAGPPPTMQHVVRSFMGMFVGCTAMSG
jgi:hypothetical protein